MQILQCGTKLRKFKLSHCGVSNNEMRELVGLIKQKPILPNIASITWSDEAECSEEGDDWDWNLLGELLKTFNRTFPHLKL
jgi:hypothetical protein